MKIKTQVGYQFGMLFRVIMLIFLIAFLGACVGVKPYQKERLADRTMIFDYDVASSILRADILSSRQGAIGGFSSASAGGCSCK